MIDALGRPQSVLLLGGTSEIGLAIVRALPPERLTRIVLAGRDRGRLERVAEELKARMRAPAAVEVVELDALATQTHQVGLDAVFDAGDIDITVLAIGTLPDQAAAEANPALAVAAVEAGFVGPLSLLLHVGRRLRGQGHGVFVVLSSVAGRQARRTNWIYGSGKAGLDFAALGLGDSLADTGARVLVVRPGVVRTPHDRTLADASALSPPRRRRRNRGRSARAPQPCGLQLPGCSRGGRRPGGAPPCRPAPAPVLTALVTRAARATSTTGTPAWTSNTA